MAVYQTNTALLRSALIGNAIFSIVCSVLFFFNPEDIAEQIFSKNKIWFELESNQFIFNLGIGLSLFAILVLFRASQKHISKPDIRAIIIGDLIWVLISFLLIVVPNNTFTDDGYRYVSLVAIIVFIFSILQIIGLRQVYQGKSHVQIENHKNNLVLRASKMVNTTADLAWRVINNHQEYADVADNIAKVEVIKGEGFGMERRCTNLKGESWTEVANIWEEGRRYGFVVNTDAQDYPYPLQHLSGIWAVIPHDANCSELIMEFKVIPKSGIKGMLFKRLMSLTFPKVVDKLFEKWAKKMERQ